MTKNKYKFMCLGYIAKNDDEVDKYVISVVTDDHGREQVLLVTPEKIASHISMKRVFLDENIIYTQTKKEHSQWLNDVFSKKLNALSSLSLS